MGGLEKKQLHPQIKNSKILIDTTQKLNRWNKYIEELFDNQRSNPTDLILNENDMSRLITKEEVLHTLEIMKNGKRTGLDEISSDILVCIDEA